MKLKLSKNPEIKREVVRGDIIVMKNKHRIDLFKYYLIIEDSPRDNYTVVNMETNHLVSSIRSICPSGLADEMKSKLSQLEYVEVITVEEYEVVLKK